MVGIGHELRGDDGAGLAAARALAEAGVPSHVLPVAAGHAPENHTSPIRRFAPALVLLVDAARLDAAPGTIRLLPWQETSGLSATTHTMPPYMLARYLVAALDCEVALLGIQPGQLALNQSLSDPVREAVGEVTAVLAQTLREL